MKFLKIFNTRIDSEELLEAIKSHGEGKVILVKHHWAKLLPSLLFTLLSLGLLALIIYIINANINDGNDLIFWGVAIFYIITTLSWTGFAVYGIIDKILFQINEKKKYIEDAEIANKRKKRFEIFLRRSTGIFIFHILFVVFNSSVPFIIDLTGRGNTTAPIVILILDFLFLINVSVVMYRIIDYEMNFGICTPDSLKLFKQTGILSSDVSDISPQSINIIKYNRKGLLQALFHYGSISLYTDAEIRNGGESNIVLNYIPDSKNIVKKLNEILGKS